MANVPQVIKPKTAVYRLHGSLAALVKESTWHRMLNGDPVGVWEPDRDRWTLVMNGTVVETIVIRHSPGDDIERSMRKAVEQFSRMSPAFRADSDKAFNKPTRANMQKFTEKWAVRSGYPNVLFLSLADIKRHRREDMDALKLSNRMRELIKKQVTLDAIQDELKFGIKREGKD